jgi:hypothetical protein
LEDTEAAARAGCAAADNGFRTPTLAIMLAIKVTGRAGGGGRGVDASISMPAII